jgi:hypothetical protein
VLLPGDVDGATEFSLSVVRGGRIAIQEHFTGDAVQFCFERAVAGAVASRKGFVDDLCRPQTSFQRLQGDIYGMISDAKKLLLGVISFADFAPKGRLTRKLTHTVNRAAPMQASCGRCQL